MRHGLDYQANSLDRNRRNWQKLLEGAIVETIKVVNPITNNSTAIGLLVDPAGGLTTKTAGLGVKVGTTSTLISTGVGGIDLNTQTSTTILAGPVSGAAAAPTFRALSTFVDNSTLTVTSTGVLKAVASTLDTPIIAGDASITIGSSTGSTTVVVKESSTGAISTGANGILVLLADNSLKTSSTGLQVRLDNINPGISTNSLGLFIGSDASISVSGATVSVNKRGTGGLKVVDATGLFVTGMQILTSDPGSPADGDQWYNNTAIAARFHEGGVTLGHSFLAYSNTANGTTASTSASTITLQTASFPANFLTAGKTIRVHIHGLYSAAASPGTLKIGLFYLPTGGTNVALDGNPSFSPAGGAAGAQFQMDYVIQCRSAGSTGVLYLTGTEFFNAASVTFGPVDNFGATVDTTKAFTLAVVLTWSSTTAGNSASADAFTVEILDPPS